MEQSVILRDMVMKEEIGVIGGLYNVENGQVEFFEDTWLSGEVHNVFEEFLIA